MSYSFSVQGATPEDVMDKIAKHLEEVVKQQEVHAVDSEAALDATAGMVAVLPEPAEDEEYYVSVNGSVSYTKPDNDTTKITSVSVGISASIGKK
jgi:membrane protein implicated in regulation of membrane protease activity